MDSGPRTVSLNRRRLIHSPSHNLNSSLRLPLSGMRVLPPILLLLSSPHRIGLLNRSSSTCGTSGTSNSCFRHRFALNGYLYDHNRSEWLLLRTLYFGRRWLVLSLRKRMSPSVSSSSNRWVDWVRSGHTVEMKPDTLDDHLCTCTAHSGSKKVHDWVVDQLVDLSSQHIQWKHNT